MKLGAQLKTARGIYLHYSIITMTDVLWLPVKWWM